MRILYFLDHSTAVNNIVFATNVKENLQMQFQRFLKMCSEYYSDYYDILVDKIMLHNIIKGNVLSRSSMHKLASCFQSVGICIFCDKSGLHGFNVNRDQRQNVKPV